MLRRKLACSFCGKGEANVAKLVAGPRVYICDQCAAEVIRIMDGPIILTHCFTEHAGHSECEQHECCPVREPLRKVHEGILKLLSNITISDISSEDMGIPTISSMVSSIQPSSIQPARVTR